MDTIEDVRLATPIGLASENMRAERRFARDDGFALALARAMPIEANVDVVCSDVRYIEYACGGYISAHVDGSRVCARTGARTNASALVFLTDVPEGEGGETEFLKSVTSDESEVLFSVRPTRGAMVIFNHDTPHVGRCVGAYPKRLLRLDVVRRNKGDERDVDEVVDENERNSVVV